MADTNVIKYISLDNMTLYTQLMRAVIDAGDAKSLKTVMLSQDNKKLLFYRSSEPISAGTDPDYEITIPETNLDSCMKKIVSAVQNHVAAFDANGQVQDTGVLITDLVTQADVQQLIATAVEQSSHITTTIVTELPSDADAKDNVIYLIKDDTVAAGEDAYEEYLKINGTLQKIGSTAVNLNGYATQTWVTDKINAEKANIIAEAVATADSHADAKDQTTLASANSYTDQKVQGLNEAIEVVDGKADANATSITNINTTLQSHGDRISLLEQNTGISMVAATSEEIRALFSE